MTELETVINKYGYKLKHAVINSRQKNHRYIYDNEVLKILIEFTPKL